jgi:NAD/NADP transhydrogenase alpha subunit
MKETRAGETRVALIPKDVNTLVDKGHKVYIEHNAGEKAGFSDQDYQIAGAEIRYMNDENDSVDNYKHLFKGIDIIVRVKRPDRCREILENKALLPVMVMIGALDPLEKHSSHMQEYHHAGITTYSIDQLNLEADDPMNVLAAMSKIAGRLALLDAIDKYHSNIKKVVIIGFGIVGRAAFDEAFNRKLNVTVMVNNLSKIDEITKQKANFLLLDNKADLNQQQEIIKQIVCDADIVITSARKSNQPAPLLIPLATLEHMKKGSVIVDMALSEGGNVEGSEHDMTHVLGNGIIVTNTSGYPKALPHDASLLWSKASLLFILKLI